MYSRNLTEVILPGHGDNVPTKSTDDTDTTSAYLTAVYQHPSLKEEHGAGLVSLDINTECANHEYVEGLYCR